MSGQYEMLLEQNTDVPMRDGAILRANVYRPNAGGRFPVLHDDTGSIGTKNRV